LSEKLKGFSQTNNKAEILAAIKAIHLAIEYNAGDLVIYTDSKYLVKCVKWISLWKINGRKTMRNSDVKNMEDLKMLDQLCSQIKIKWVCS
jgi:ribonuclease HI